MKKYGWPIIVIWGILFCLTLVGFMVFSKLGVQRVENLVGGTGLVISTIIIFVIQMRVNVKDKRLDKIDSSIMSISNDLKLKASQDYVHEVNQNMLDRVEEYRQIHEGYSKRTEESIREISKFIFDHVDIKK